MKLLGALFVLGGIIGLIYFLGFYDTGVAVPRLNPADYGMERLPPPSIDRVHNLGRLQNRQNGIIVSLGGVIVGAILFAVRPAAPVVILRPLDKQPDEGFAYYSDALPGQKPKDPMIQWMLECVRADAAQRPRPPKPQTGY